MHILISALWGFTLALSVTTAYNMNKLEQKVEEQEVRLQEQKVLLDETIEVQRKLVDAVVKNSTP